MKKIALLIFVAAVVFSLTGCVRSSSPKVDSFESHLAALSDDPEEAVGFSLRYNNTANLDDAFTKLCGFTSNDWYVSSNDAEDAWIYVSRYIDALHAEIDELYEEYQDAY